MQKITVIAVGADKEPYFSEAAAEYEKRLSRFCRTETVILRDEPIPENASDKEAAAVLEREGAKILAVLPDNAFRVALCVEGRQLSSPELAKLLEDASAAHPGIAFVIGGSLGLSEKVKAACDLRLSVSKLTFPHRMMRVILLEALYRAKTISNGMKYHK